MADLVQYYGTGRRKSAIARVYLRPGSGNFAVNGKPFETYFVTEQQRVAAKKSLVVSDTAATFDVVTTVSGGGVAAQADAVSARSRLRSRSGPLRSATASASPPGAAPLSRRTRFTSGSDTDSDVPERGGLPVSRSTARRCSTVAPVRVTVPVSGRPASSRSRARWTSQAVGSPPRRRCSLVPSSAVSVTAPPGRPCGVPGRPTATA